jgi:hypothetical protein
MDLFCCFFECFVQVGRSHAPNDTPVHSALGTAGAAALATVFSSPFNYVRSIQYAHLTNTDEPPRRIVMQLGRLWSNAKQQPSPIRYLGQRLRIGWGTARVATSMALSQAVFAEIKNRKRNVD